MEIRIKDEFIKLGQALKLAGELGMDVRNYENYVGTADLNDQETGIWPVLWRTALRRNMPSMMVWYW